MASSCAAFSNYSTPASGATLIVSIAGVNDTAAYYVNYTFGIVRTYCNISQIAPISDPSVYNSTQVLTSPGAWSTVAITQTPQSSVSLFVTLQGSCNTSMAKFAYLNSTMLSCTGSVCPLARGSNYYSVTAFNSDNTSVITTANFNLTNIQISAYGAVLNQAATQGMGYCNSYSLAAVVPFGYSTTLTNATSFPITKTEVDYAVSAVKIPDLLLDSSIFVTPCLKLINLLYLIIKQLQRWPTSQRYHLGQVEHLYNFHH